MSGRMVAINADCRSSRPQMHRTQASTMAGNKETIRARRVQRLESATRTPWRVIASQRQAWPDNSPDQC